MAFLKSLRITVTQLRFTICTTMSARFNQTLRVTPAMEAGIADHVWTIRPSVARHAMKNNSLHWEGPRVYKKPIWERLLSSFRVHTATGSIASRMWRVIMAGQGDDNPCK